jgi:hypothetical protein
MAISLPEAGGDMAIVAIKDRTQRPDFLVMAQILVCNALVAAPTQRPCSSPRSMAARKWMPP